MSKQVNRGGGGFLQWWNDPKNRKKVFASDKADAEELKKTAERENALAKTTKTTSKPQE